jgi:hypothetical protein
MNGRQFAGRDAMHIPSRFVLPSLLYPGRRGTIALAIIVWTISPRWLVVTLRNRMIP